MSSIPCQDALNKQSKSTKNGFFRSKMDGAMGSESNAQILNKMTLIDRIKFF